MVLVQPDPLPHLVLVVVCVLSAWTDVRTGLISDYVTLSGLAAGLILAVTLHGVSGLWSAALGAGMGFGIFGILWLIKTMESGDVFLMGSVGSLLGFPAVLWGMLLSSLFGVLVGIAWMVAQGRTKQVVSNMVSMFRRAWKSDEPSIEGTPFPFGLAIAAGSLYTAAIAYWPALAPSWL
ncbi:MAG: prepilin peptidase [Deltaproteobacteria bacterium]|nr:prepilin peptidase [Deltaproteobacteria bacterium]